MRGILIEYVKNVSPLQKSVVSCGPRYQIKEDGGWDLAADCEFVSIYDHIR